MSHPVGVADHEAPVLRGQLVGLRKQDERRGLSQDVEGDQCSDTQPCSMDAHERTPAVIRTQAKDFAVSPRTPRRYESLGYDVSLAGETSRLHSLTGPLRLSPPGFPATNFFLQRRLLCCVWWEDRGVPTRRTVRRTTVFAKVKRRPEGPPPTVGPCSRERGLLWLIHLTLTLHLFVLLHHFLLHLLPFGLLVRCQEIGRA